MSTYTKRLGGTRQSSGSTVVLHTPPAGTRSVVRDVIFYNESSAAQIGLLYISTGGQNIVIVYVSLPALSTTHYDMRQVVEVGEELVATVATNATWSVAVTGYSFVL